MYSANRSISITEITTDPTMTRKTSVIPTTVRMESTENSRFMPTMRKTTWPKRSTSSTSCSIPLAFNLSSLTPFHIKKSPPMMSTKDFPLSSTCSLSHEG